ncbi:DNA binding protein [Zea mays]|uniref:DNA binding protein n=1 Tax=Zea mays TaxID=4577 RepID=A0A1Q0ZAZ1_MAIZE|nr:DNA binding protein [Zea mays]
MTRLTMVRRLERAAGDPKKLRILNSGRTWSETYRMRKGRRVDLVKIMVFQMIEIAKASVLHPRWRLKGLRLIKCIFSLVMLQGKMRDWYNRASVPIDKRMGHQYGILKASPLLLKELWVAFHQHLQRRKNSKLQGLYPILKLHPEKRGLDSESVTLAYWFQRELKTQTEMLRRKKLGPPLHCLQILLMLCIREMTRLVGQWRTHKYPCRDLAAHRCQLQQWGWTEEHLGHPSQARALQSGDRMELYGRLKTFLSLLRNLMQETFHLLLVRKRNKVEGCCKQIFQLIRNWLCQNHQLWRKLHTEVLKGRRRSAEMGCLMLPRKRTKRVTGMRKRKGKRKINTKRGKRRKRQRRRKRSIITRSMIRQERTI